MGQHTESETESADIAESRLHVSRGSCQMSWLAAGLLAVWALLLSGLLFYVLLPPSMNVSANSSFLVVQAASLPFIARSSIHGQAL
jgi:hypothetical protein